MTPSLKIRLLGGFQISADGLPGGGLIAPRLQSLLAFLILNRAVPQSRQRLAFLLWPDASEEQARTNLRKAFHHLRQALPGPDTFLCSSGMTLHWNPTAPFTLDVADFEVAISEGRLQHAVELYTGDLLPDCYDEWVFAERERLHQAYLEALARLAQQKEIEQDYPAAIGYAQRLLQRDPLREEIYRQVMRLHALNGDRAAALHAYQSCATLLQRELGIEPSHATRQYYERLRELKNLPATSTFLTGSLPLVGRAEEWKRLQEAWRTAAQGKPAMILITGEAGIGKTRLAEELMAWVDRQANPVLGTSCYAVESASAYAPLTTWLRERVSPALEPAWLAEVARLLPELASEGMVAASPGPLSEPWQRQRFYEAMVRAVLGPELAISSPLLLLIEDLQWCDSDSLEWLNYLLRYNQRSRFLVVGTLRTDAAVHGDHLEALLIGLKKRSQLAEIELKPLNLAETTLLGKEVLARSLDSETAACLFRETEGNPLFIVEFARAGLVQAVELPPGEEIAAILPPAVQAAVAARLGQLSPQAAKVMQLAAIIGREFTFEVLSIAGALDEDALVDALDELWQRRVIREQGKNMPQQAGQRANKIAYDFTHDKLRQVACAGLSAPRKRLLHKRVAEALVVVSGESTEAFSGQIGWHYEQTGNYEAAAHWLWKTGQAAEQVGALAEALAYLSRALALIPETRSSERFAILLQREKVNRVLAERETQWQDLAELDALAAALDDGSQDAALRRTQAALEKGAYFRDTSDFLSAKAAANEALTWVEQAGQHRIEPSLPGKGPELACLEFDALFLMGEILEFQGEFLAALPYRQKGIELARAAGLRREEARALFGLAYVLEDKAEAAACLETALPIYREISDKQGESECLDALGYKYLWLGDYTAARSCYDASLQVARQIGYRRLEALSLFHLGHFHNHLGDYEAGKRYLEQVLNIAREDHDQRRTAYVLFNIGVSEQGLGSPETAIALCEEAQVICQSIHDLNGDVIASLVLGRCYEILGQWEAAVATLQKGFVLLQSMGAPAAEKYFQARLGRALLRLGDPVQALALVEQVLAFVEQGGDISGTDEGPIPIYQACYDVLNALDDPRAGKLLEIAHTYLQGQAARIQDKAMRRSYLENKFENRELLDSLRQAQG